MTEIRPRHGADAAGSTEGRARPVRRHGRPPTAPAASALIQRQSGRLPPSRGNLQPTRCAPTPGRRQPAAFQSGAHLPSAGCTARGSRRGDPALPDVHLDGVIAFGVELGAFSSRWPTTRSSPWRRPRAGAACRPGPVLGHSALVQQFLRGRSAWRRGSTRVKRPAIRPVRSSLRRASTSALWAPK
jgi:hypothetical protein